MEDKELYQLLDSCRKGNRTSQDKLYRLFYGYALGICLRYSRSHEEAVEILNDGFIKIFTRLDKYTKGLSFKGWVRKVMINCAIDYFRKNERHYRSLDISHASYEASPAFVLEQLSEQDIIAAIQQLPSSYRIVFNLHAIEGYKHEEIATILGISEGTSKSNLSIARAKLKKLLIAGAREKIRQEGNG